MHTSSYFVLIIIVVINFLNIQHINGSKSHLRTSAHKKTVNNNLLMSQQGIPDLSKLQDQHQLVSPSGEFIVDANTEIALDKPYDNPILNDVPTWHNQPTKPSKGGGGGGGAAASAKGKNTADDGARMGEDFATVSKAEQIMDDKAPFNPNIAAALDVPEPKVISSSTYNDPNFLAGLDPHSNLDKSGNGRNDIGKWQERNNAANTYDDTYDQNYDMEQSTNDAPPMHRAGGGEGQFKTLDGNVDEENMEGVPNTQSSKDENAGNNNNKYGGGNSKSSNSGGNSNSGGGNRKNSGSNSGGGGGNNNAAPTNVETGGASCSAGGASYLNKGTSGYNRLYNQLATHEGKVLNNYYDSLGKPTFGIGHLIKSSDPEYGKKCCPQSRVHCSNGFKVSEQRVKEVFEYDLLKHIKQAKRIYSNFNNLPAIAQLVIADMAFNMGQFNFPGMKRGVMNGDYVEASKQMTDSKWCGQVHGRCTTLVNMMRSIGKCSPP